jgi:hypothetical protein
VQSRLCNLPHLAGLYKMVGATGRLVALSARGAVADMLLWAIARVQTRVFASDSYRKCVLRFIPLTVALTQTPVCSTSVDELPGSSEGSAAPCGACNRAEWHVRRAMDVVAAEAAADAAAEQESTRELQRSQEEAALAASRLQRMRAQRVRRLKVPTL